MTQRSLDRRIVLAMAVAAGASVASIYYAQPLLDEIARSVDVSRGTVGFLVTASQLGFAAGLALVTPLGDLIERRGLVVRMLAVCGVALAAVALAPTFAVLVVALGVVGVTASAAQVLVPFAATLAGEHERGRVVGIVMSGLLIGILVARTVSGILGQYGGWRLVFWLAAAVIAVLTVVLRRLLPVSRPTATLSYGRLLASIVGLVRTEPVLRRRMVFGGCGMAGFSALWTTLTFLLAGAPYHYGAATIGLFGIAGLAGALAAQAAGRFADRGQLEPATGGFLLAVLGGWGLLAFGHVSLAAVIAGIVVLDLGLQGQHICNQSAIYAIDGDARGRLTAAYQTSNFLFGALGSALATVVFAADGWGAVVVLGSAIATLSLGVWLATTARARRAVRPVVVAREQS